MSSRLLAFITNHPLFRYVSLRQGAVWALWDRQLMIQLTVLLFGLFYSCAVLEIDLNENGDSFGDVYDTYVTSAPFQTPKPTLGEHRRSLIDQPVLATVQRSLVLPIAHSFVLTLILATPALCIVIHRKRRRPQVLHAVWRL